MLLVRIASVETWRTTLLGTLFGAFDMELTHSQIQELLALCEKAMGTHSTWSEQDQVCQEYTDRARTAIPQLCKQLEEVMNLLIEQHIPIGVSCCSTECKFCQRIAAYREGK